ncbi:MAG: ATP-binding protein [Rhodobacteraceae bacterium]|nr:ATP-binding protein [Paracoccaceae bacterium]
MSLATRLAEERRARLAAERLLELKQAELFAANRKLDAHARALSHQVEETQAENEQVKSDLNAAHERVQIAEQRLWLSLHTIQDGFAFFDATGGLISANPAYLSAFEGIEEVVPGVNYTRILEILTNEGIVDTQGEAAEDWLARMLQRWRSATPDPEVLRLWNGQYVRVVDRRNPSGDMVTLALNITDSVRSEKRLREAQRRAEAANRAKSAFLANMSHEIRTPMNGVIGIADLLAGTDMTEEQGLYVDTIRNSGEALLAIINDVLDYSKIEADRLVLKSAPFDLERAMHEVVLLLQPAAREKGLELLVDCDLFLPSMFVGDAGRIRQVLTNLIGNAVKFTETGHILVRAVGLPAGGTATTLHLTVEDTGIGIPEDRLKHIFGEFNQIDDAQNRKFEGTGLGLTISKRLVELMQGDVWVDSEVGVGSCFGLQITLKNADLTNAPPMAKPSWLKTALVAGARSETRDILCNQLQSLGLQTTTCDSAKAVMALFPHQADILLVDDSLSDLPAFSLAQQLHDADVTAPVLLMSNDHDPLVPAPLAPDSGRPLVQSILPKIVPRRFLLAELCKAGSPELDQNTYPENAQTAVPIGAQASERVSVLVAEDNLTNQFVFEKMVEDRNIDLTFVTNGIEATEAFKRIAPDMIFMDISMPLMDGKEATGRIRKLPGGAEVPIIAVTAHAMSSDRDVVLASGLTDYVTKPLRKMALVELLDRYRPAKPGDRYTARTKTGVSGADRSGR